jgi:hypothetical protein
MNGRLPYRLSEPTAHLASGTLRDHVYPEPTDGAAFVHDGYAKDASILALSTTSAWPTSACIMSSSPHRKND